MISEPKSEQGTVTPVPLRAKPSASGFARKRRSSGVSEFSPKGGNERYGACDDAGQAKKSARGMPWHQEPTKDVTSCDKPRGGANIR